MVGHRLMLHRDFGSCLCNDVSFLSYFLTLTPSVSGFAELSVTLLVNVVVMSVFISF